MEEEKLHIKITECENAVNAIEQFLNIEGTKDILEFRRNKYRVDYLNIAATIASFRLFFMITRDLLPENHELVVYYKLNISLLSYVLTNEHFKDICIGHKIDILLTNGFSLNHGFVWYPKNIDQCSF